MAAEGMRLSDWFVFLHAAQAFKMWILVRWTNAESLKYIGRRGYDVRLGKALDYAPKPIDCKPKTADINVDKYELAGLVIDPTIHKAFAKESKVGKAIKSWDSFLSHLHVKSAEELNRQSVSTHTAALMPATTRQVMHVQATRGGVSRDMLREINTRPGGAALERSFMVDLDPASKHYGCLTLNGKYLHGDYDLKDIIDPARFGPNTAVAETMHGQAHMRTAELDPILKYVNAQIGVKMVQHGSEAQYADHTDDEIEVFGPRGEAHTLRGIDEIKKWYKYGWNRETIDPKRKSLGAYIAPPSRVHTSTSSGGVILMGADLRK